MILWSCDGIQEDELKCCWDIVYNLSVPCLSVVRAIIKSFEDREIGSNGLYKVCGDDLVELLHLAESRSRSNISTLTSTIVSMFFDAYDHKDLCVSAACFLPFREEGEMCTRLRDEGRVVELCAKNPELSDVKYLSHAVSWWKKQFELPDLSSNAELDRIESSIVTELLEEFRQKTTIYDLCTGLFLYKVLGINLASVACQV